MAALKSQLGVDMRAAQRKLSASRTKLRKTTQLDYKSHASAAGTLAGILATLDEIETVVNP